MVFNVQQEKVYWKMHRSLWDTKRNRKLLSEGEREAAMGLGVSFLGGWKAKRWGRPQKTERMRGMDHRTLLPCSCGLQETWPLHTGLKVRAHVICQEHVKLQAQKTPNFLWTGRKEENA